MPSPFIHKFRLIYGFASLYISCLTAEKFLKKDPSFIQTYTLEPKKETNLKYIYFRPALVFLYSGSRHHFASALSSGGVEMLSE